jgi:hypothetical protein
MRKEHTFQASYLIYGVVDDLGDERKIRARCPMGQIYSYIFRFLINQAQRVVWHLSSFFLKRVLEVGSACLEAFKLLNGPIQTQLSRSKVCTMVELFLAASDVNSRGESSSENKKRRSRSREVYPPIHCARSAAAPSHSLPSPQTHARASWLPFSIYDSQAIRFLCFLVVLSNQSHSVTDLDHLGVVCIISSYIRPTLSIRL